MRRRQHLITLSSRMAAISTLHQLFLLLVISDGNHPHALQNEQLSPSLRQPELVSVSSTFRSELGGNVRLPCVVRDLGPFVLLWKKGTRVLTAGNIMVRRDERVRLLGTDLEINDVRIEDNGNYSCVIEADSEYPVAIRHQLQVLVAPRLTLDASERRVEVRSSANVNLRCRVTGRPTPRVTWSKIHGQIDGDRVTFSSDMATLMMTNVSRHHEGVYRCHADNGVGQPVVADIELNVEYEPEVIGERDVVHGGRGFPAELSCLVHSNPSAEVVWYRNTMRLEQNDKRYMQSRGNRHTLFLRKVESDDFANYSCYAVNMLGRGRAFVALKGTPNVPEIGSQVLSDGATSYRIAWVTESFTPIDEYRLLFRRVLSEETSSSSSSSSVSMRHAWHKLRLPPQTSLGLGALGTRFHEAYTLGPLEADAAFEVRVAAKNEHGWSELSPIFHFYTQPQGLSPQQNFVKRPEEAEAAAAASADVVGGSSEVSSGKSASSDCERASDNGLAVVASLIMALLTMAVMSGK